MHQSQDIADEFASAVLGSIRLDFSSDPKNGIDLRTVQFLFRMGDVRQAGELPKQDKHFRPQTSLAKMQSTNALVKRLLVMQRLLPTIILIFLSNDQRQYSLVLQVSHCIMSHIQKKRNQSH